MALCKIKNSKFAEVKLNKNVILIALFIIFATVYYLQLNFKKDSQENIPNYVLETLQYINRFKSAPQGFIGGRRFMNREQKLLPLNYKNGLIYYKEWDVFQKIEGKNRGPERLVTGNNSTAYYTNNHYKSFIKIR